MERSLDLLWIKRGDLSGQLPAWPALKKQEPRTKNPMDKRPVWDENGESLNYFIACNWAKLFFSFPRIVFNWMNKEKLNKEAWTN